MNPKKPEKQDDNTFGSTGYYADTSVRKDVMNKTIFRSIRREYKQQFRAFCKEKGYKIARTLKYLEKAIGEFTQKILEQEDMEELHQRYGEMPNLAYYVGLFVDFCKMRKIAKKYPDQTILHSFYDCLYGYSHKKFYEFLAAPEVKFLFNRMLTPEKVEEMIENCPTLKRNQHHYRVCAKSLTC